MKTNNFLPRFVDMILSKENRESLKDVNFSKLAKKIQIPPATFHQWLTGAFPKRIEHWEKLQKYFECDLTYLITGIAGGKKEFPDEGKFIISDSTKKLVECTYKIRKDLGITCPHYRL